MASRRSWFTMEKRPRSERPRSSSASSSSSKRNSGDRKSPKKSGASRSNQSSKNDRPVRPGRDQRVTKGAKSVKPAVEQPRRLEPEIPQEIYREEIDKQLLHELSSLASDNAEQTARHLLALVYFMPEDPQRAFEHGVAASARAARVGRVRELAGIAAYNAEKFDVALRELKTAFRITGDPSLWPMIADSHRGLGEPLKALEMGKAPETEKLDRDSRVELRIVLSGARRDLGELAAALTTLECKELREENPLWSARLRYAYADLLEALGRLTEARDWFNKAAAVDIDQLTDSSDRARALATKN